MKDFCQYGNRSENEWEILPSHPYAISLLLKISDGLWTEEFRRLGLTGSREDWERLVLRSIGIFMNGHTRNIPDLYDGTIEITPIPTVEELNAHVWGEAFYASVIETAEFEAIREIVELWKNEDSGKIESAWSEHLD